MNKLLFIEVLRDAFLISEEAVQMYSYAAYEFLSGNQVVSTGLFSEIALPSVPDNVALIPMAGVLTKADICGAMGSRTLTSKINAAAKDSQIDTILIYSENCPGGQVDGTSTMADAIISANKRKPVLGAVSGIACSAAVWVLSGCQEIFATSETDQVGCIGVMAKMRNPKAVKPGEQEFVTLYSDHSPDKNAEFRNPDLMIKSYLNPVAKLFHSAVMAGRGDRLQLAKEDVLSGKTYIARVAASSGLIDGVLPFDKIISRSIHLSKQKRK